MDNIKNFIDNKYVKTRVYLVVYKIYTTRISNMELFII